MLTKKVDFKYYWFPCCTCNLLVLLNVDVVGVGFDLLFISPSLISVFYPPPLQ